MWTVAHFSVKGSLASERDVNGDFGGFSP